MNRMCFLLLALLYSSAPIKSACGLHEVVLNGGDGITEGHVDSYGRTAGAVNHHTVWLYTRAACDSIRWTLGGKTHSGHLACGVAMGFMAVPEGTHHVVIEGCGKRIAAYLSVKSDLQVMIEPSDLNAGGSCEAGDSPGAGGSYYADFMESLSSSSFISEL